MVRRFITAGDVGGAMNKHTPGKWKVDSNLHHDIVVFSPWSEEVKPENTATFGDCRGAYICYLPYNSGIPTKEQAEANARLIAAAPDLLEALKHAKSLLWTHSIKSATIEQAIAKAEGI